MKGLENMRDQLNMPAALDQIARNQARTDAPGDTNGAQAVPETFAALKEARDALSRIAAMAARSAYTEWAAPIHSEAFCAIRDINKVLVPLPLPTP